MVGWYHLICWTPLSSKISLHSPPHPHAPTLRTRLTLSLYALWGKSLSVEAESECTPLLWCNWTLQQVVWSCFGPEKLLFFFNLNHHISWEGQTTDYLWSLRSVWVLFSNLSLPLCQAKSLIQIQFESEDLITIKESMFTYLNTLDECYNTERL